MLPHYNEVDAEAADLRKADRNTWWKVQGRLQTTLRTCAQFALQEKKISQEQHKRYTRSGRLYKRAFCILNKIYHGNIGMLCRKHY